VFVERSLEVGREEPVLDVHPRRQTQLGHAPQDEGLIGRLLRILAEDHDPAGVERAVDVVVPAVDVERVFGQRSRRDLEHHRRALARRVVILLDAVDDALAGGVVDDPFAAHGVRDGSALGGVLAFGLDRNRAAAEHVQIAFSERLLVQLASLCRGSDRVEDAGVCYPRFGVVGNELVAVGGNPNARIPRLVLHATFLLPRRPGSPRVRRRLKPWWGLLAGILPPRRWRHNC
jgi:hypothetical protein